MLGNFRKTPCKETGKLQEDTMYGNKATDHRLDIAALQTPQHTVSPDCQWTNPKSDLKLEASRPQDGGHTIPNNSS